MLHQGPQLTAHNILVDLGDEVDSYIIFTHENDALCVDNKYIDKFLYQKQQYKNDETIGWSNVFYFKNQSKNAEVINDISEVFKTFKVFKNNYEFEQKHAKFIKLINLLDLGDYQVAFLNALSAKRLELKYITNEHQNGLNIIFNKLFEDGESCSYAEHGAKPIKLKDFHINNIFNAYNFSDRTDKEKGQLLLILSGIFAKYSSSSYFGTEENSPIALRYYAFALMKKAVELHPDIISVENYNTYTNKFLGIGDAFTCTAVLSSNILSACSQFMKLDAYAGIIPPTWQ